MRWLRGVTDTWQKSKAAAVLEGLLKEQQSLGLYPMDPHRTANAMVDAAWQIRPDLFDGSKGQKAHKMALAGVALANGMSSLSIGDPDHFSLFIALRKFIYETVSKPQSYRFTRLDDDLLDGVIQQYVKAEREIERKDDGI